MNNERTKNSTKNIAVGFVYQTLTICLSFISRTIFIHTLGTEYLGLNGIFSDVLSLLSMADLGFSTAMAYSFYKPLAENDTKTITALIHFYRKIYNVIAIAVSVLGLACVPFLRSIINLEKELPNLEVFYILSLANVVFSYLFVYKTTLMTAAQKDFKLVAIRMWTSILKTLLQSILLLIWQNYIAYITIGVLMQLLNNIIASKKTEKDFPYIKAKNNADKVTKEVEQNIFKNMKSVFLYKISSTLFTATDNIIISSIIGTAIVGLYSNYLLLSQKLLLVEQIVFSSLTASIGNVVAADSPQKRLQVFQAMQSASFIFCGIITTCFCILANDFVTVWLGKDYLLSSLTVIAISLNTYFSCVMQPLWSYRDATGLYIKTKYIMLIGCFVNIILSILLGHFIGIAGVIFASAIARISTYFWYEPKLLFKQFFESKLGKYYLSLLLNFVVVIATIIVCSFVTSSIVVDGWISLLYKGTIVATICIVTFMLLYSKTEGFKIILNKIKLIVKK